MEFQTAEDMMFKSSVLEEADLADFAVIMKVSATSTYNAVILLGDVHHVNVIVTDTADTGLRIPGTNNANLFRRSTSWPETSKEIWSTDIPK